MGERYAAPWFIDTRALFYRKTIVKWPELILKPILKQDFVQALEKLKGLVVDGKEIARLYLVRRLVLYITMHLGWGAGGDL